MRALQRGQGLPRLRKSLKQNFFEFPVGILFGFLFFLVLRIGTTRADLFIYFCLQLVLLRKAIKVQMHSGKKAAKISRPFVKGPSISTEFALYQLRRKRHILKQSPRQRLRNLTFIQSRGGKRFLVVSSASKQSEMHSLGTIKNR